MAEVVDFKPSADNSDGAGLALTFFEECMIATPKRWLIKNEGQLTAFRGERIELGVDEDGEPFGAFIISAEMIEGATAQPTKANNPTKAAQIALRALSEELADTGRPAPPDPHIPADVSVVPVSAWRHRAYRMGISTSGEERARQQAFKRGTEWLIGNSRVAVWDDLAWLPR